MLLYFCLSSFDITIGVLINMSQLSWAKGFQGCYIVTAALEQRESVNVAELRILLVDAGFSNNEISKIFDLMRLQQIVKIAEETVWRLNGTTFNLR